MDRDGREINLTACNAAERQYGGAYDEWPRGHPVSGMGEGDQSAIRRARPTACLRTFGEDAIIGRSRDLGPNSGFVGTVLNVADPS